MSGQRGGDTPTRARQRWCLLAAALTGAPHDYARTDPTSVSVRRFSSFGAIHREQEQDIQDKGGAWLRFKSRKKWLLVKVCSAPVSPVDLIGFNNTGNVCVWPSEEALSVLVLANLEVFNGKRVLELGGGLSCLAGLFLSKYGYPERVLVTDGNAKCVDNVRAVIEKNGLDAECELLRWNVPSDRGNGDRFDAILVADCLFFEETREDLIETISNCLESDGTAYVMAPRRGNTLDDFVRASRVRGFVCDAVERYDASIWRRHLELLETDRNYDPSLHYPILLKMTRKN